jgi:hypothetical protein
MVDGSVHSVCNLISVRRSPALVDIHRPMPIFAEDCGGNSVDVRFISRTMNLHSLWDTGLVNEAQGPSLRPNRLLLSSGESGFALGEMKVDQI